MRKVKYLLVFICLMLVSCAEHYNQTNEVMVVNSVSKYPKGLHKYVIHVADGKYYWVMELIDEAGKYNVGDTLIIGKHDR
jgi:hypothetical protein